MIAACLAICAVLLNWFPQWAASVWSLFSGEPMFQWLGEHHMLRLTFSPIYVTGPVSFGLLAIILWGLFSPARKNKVPPEPQPAPQLRMSCHPKIPGCVKETRFTRERIPTNFFRVRVEAVGAQSIKNCTAILTSIEKDGTARWGGDSAKMTFAQGEQPDTFAKTIRNKAPEFFDVLAVTSKGEMFPGTYDANHGRWWPYHPTLPEIFSEHGDYIIAVAVSGDDVPTETATLKFRWTGNWQTSSLTEATSSRVKEED